LKVQCAHDALVNIKDLKPHPKNRNEHPKDQLERLAKILEYQGWRYPIKVSNQSGFITSGHGRLAAAKINKWKEVPVDYQDYESDEQEYADVQSDNAIASWAELNISGINADIELLGPDFDIDLLGIKNFVIEPADKDPGCDEDEVPHHVEPKTKLGDIYQLGRHRLMCGDSTSIDAVEKLMPDRSDITFTSPPYNAGRFGYDGGKDKYKGEGDDKDQDEYFKFLTEFVNIALMKTNYVFFNNQFLSGNRHALAKFFGHYAESVKDVFPWIKNTAPPNVNKGVFTNRFEFFLCLEMGNKKKGFPVEWQGKYHNVIEGHTAAKENVTKGTHSATMPVYVLPFVDTIYEPFGGSGSTLIACEKTNRKCFMMELDPHYCDVIVARWEKYTGQKAELIGG
jgi:hypothetical protein